MPKSLSVFEGVINKRLLSSSVYERMLEDIISGRYSTGVRLQVDEIARELGVSRTPVREAIQHLSMTQFVTIARNSRTEIADWSADDMRDRIEMICKLLGIVLIDARTDVSVAISIAETIATSTIDDESPKDAQLFLNFTERIVANSSNRVGRHNISELLTPLRMFFTYHVLRDHHIDLDSGAQLRRYLLAVVLDATAKGDMHGAARSLGSYLGALASDIAPRAGELLEQTMESPLTSDPKLGVIG